MLAHASHDILESALLFDDFNSAVADLDLVVCTTAKGRSAKHDYHSSLSIREQLDNKKEHLLKVGFLFGTLDVPELNIQHAATLVLASKKTRP